MNHECAVCGEPVDPIAAEPYRFGAVTGVVCLECANTLRVSIAGWMRQRLRSVASQRAQVEKQERARLAKAEAERSAQEADARRFQQLEMETLPRASRTAKRSSAA